MTIDEEIDEILKLSGTKLTEGIEEIKKYYPLINDSQMNQLLNLDPTYKGGNELGTYGKWILNLYNNFLKDENAYKKWQEQKAQGKNYSEPVKKSEERIEDFEKLPELLNQFDNIKKQAKLNINNIKSINQLYSTVKNSLKDNNISENKKVQHVLDLVNKSVELGGEIVFKDNKWIVLVPKTFKSSKVFGDDTNWCTTSSNGRYYNYYLKKFGGQYFINVNLQDGSLYQFHFESEQFMNANDNKINNEEFIQNNPDLKPFYRNYILNNSELKNNAEIWTWLNSDDITEEMQLEAVKQNPYFIRYIKNPTEEMQLEAVKQNGDAIELIKNPSEKVQLEAVKQDGTALYYIKNPSEEIQLEAVKQDGFAIRYLGNPSEKVQLEAVKQDGSALSYIENPSEKVQLEAVKRDGLNIRYIENPNKTVQLEAIKQDIAALYYIKNPSEEMQLEAVKQDWENIQLINNPSEKVQLLAITINKEAIDLIDDPTEKVQKAWQTLYGENRMSESVYDIDSQIDEILKLSGTKLDETKPARYNQHLDKSKSFANISASRSNDEFELPGKEKEKQQQSAENNRKTEQLKKDIKDMGLSYIKTWGAWRDEGPVTNEKSFLIPNITKEQALELGKKYGQYSVIFKPEDSEEAYMYITLDNENFGKEDGSFDMSGDVKFKEVKNKDNLNPYSGYTGLKPKGKGYNLSYKMK